MAPLAMSEILLPRRRRTIGFRPIRKTGPTLRINQNDPPNGLGQLAALASPAMSSDDADRYRKQAEECRQQARKAVSPLDKEAWLRVAEEWLNLAQSTEETAGACATAKFQTETLPAGLTRGLPRLVQRPWASVQRSPRINACQFKRP
jgi:hypothetical protein